MVEKDERSVPLIFDLTPHKSSRRRIGGRQMEVTDALMVE